MSLSVRYTAVCDWCDEYAEESRPTVEDAIEYVVRGGWVHRDEGLLCDRCHEMIFRGGTK